MSASLQQLYLLLGATGLCVAATSMPGCPASDNVVTSSLEAHARWQTDIHAFDRYLGRLADGASVPTLENLRDRFSLDQTAEVLVVTDGVGGYVDFNPAPGTVQRSVNDVLRGNDIRWTFKLRGDEAISWSGEVLLFPDLKHDTADKPHGEESRFLACLRFERDGLPEDREPAKAGDQVMVEATIGDFTTNRWPDLHRGPIAIYYLAGVDHPVFWIGLTDVRVVALDRATP